MPYIDPTLMAPTPLQAIWFLLIGVLLLGYFILDGFDLGSGGLYPFLAKDEQEKAFVRRSIGPLWDGNEVWLLTGGGALFAAFAPAYATAFSGFYLAIMLVLFGLIARAAAIEFRSLGDGLNKLWDAAFFLGSALPALLFGVAVGNVIEGVPLDAHGDYAGLPLIGLLRPFPLVCGVISLSQILLQGASWQALKAPVGSALHQRSVALRTPLLIVVAVAFVLATALYFGLLGDPHSAQGAGLPLLFRAVFAVVFVAGVVAALLFQRKGDDLWSFLAANIAPVALIGISATTLFPYLIPSLGPGPSITVASAGGTELALTCMTIIAAVGVPLVLVYHVIIYRTFRGRLSVEDLS
ncbi:MAG: cytochrome d ubiquinol oxidase subunit II [Coriobacteriales bacterium]|jgi:cytochrome d ubiquinol oxidase subunit II|nr:cytochrome d ubiquinol oxidase subunit II [Coriobacteriales bacterium]